MDSQMYRKARALQLKDEGNALFVKGKCDAAIDKYTQAISITADDAVLWTNRAACKLRLRKFLDAAADAEKATALDSGYAKGWARLGQACMELGNLDDSIKAYEKAVSITSSASGTDSNEKQCVQYKASLEEVKHQHQKQAKLDRAGFDRNGNPQYAEVKAGANEMPWQRAKTKMSEMRKNPATVNIESSAWVIGFAREEWEEGIKIMNHPKGGRGPYDITPFLRTPGGLDALVSALLRDHRVFHISDPKFIERYNEQITLEIQRSSAWSEGEPNSIIELAQARLGRGGPGPWKEVSPALAVTARAWISRAYIMSNIQAEHVVAVRMYQSAIDLIETGNRIWRDVPIQMRGAMFRESFIRAVKCLLMEAYIAALANNTDGTFSIRELVKLAQGVLDDTIKNHQNPPPAPPQGYDPGFVTSFYIYPKGHAYATLGLCWKRTAIGAESTNPPDVVQGKSAWKLAASFYEKAATVYFTDDEKHITSLAAALACHWKIPSTVSHTLPLIKKLGHALPLVKEIWENSLTFSEFESAFVQILQYEREVLQKREAGGNVEDVATPDI